jgi:outer membrane receptor protein involved in Fe transport
MKRLFTVISIILLLLPAGISAQTGVGKLSGRVTDAETKEPLIGANVLLLNTQAGGATNVDGDYYILNITPGTYSVKVSYVGYAPKTIQDVRIVAGITYELNVSLTTDFTLPEVVVEDKKFFEEKATSTVKVVDGDQISRMPIRGIAQIASVQSGVVMQEGSGGAGGNATINIRGGRGSEVLYIVDGIPQNNLYTRTSVAQVSNSAIEQISIMPGGFEAKYGQAQSGVINVTTKSGNPDYSVFAEVVTSSFTDDFGYNLYSGTLGGPVIPGIQNHTFFLSGERGWFADSDPIAKPIEYYYLENGEYVKKTFKTRLNNPEAVWRFSGRTNHRMGSFSANLGVIYNDNTSRVYDSRMAKNSSMFFDEVYYRNLSFSGRVSQTVSRSSFWNLTLGYRMYNLRRYNPFFEDDLEAYGDSSLWAEKFGVTLLGDGLRTSSTDAGGVMRPYGYATSLYQKRENNALTIDFDFTSQISNHLFEFGAGVSSSIVRGYGLYAFQVASATGTSELARYAALQPFVYGYDLTGQNKVGTDYSDPEAGAGGSMQRADNLQQARNPLIAYGYIQDRYELEDLVVNIGLRMDYFDLDAYEFVDPALPFAGGDVSYAFDNGDFKLRDAEIKLSPRIGIGYPVTASTVFHAQFGKFIQLPELNDLYSGPYDFQDWISSEPQQSANGALDCEETIQYEVGFRQMLGSTAALNITLFYKNIRGLVNYEARQYRETEGGEIKTAILTTNSDFGTSKGLAFSFDIARMDFFSMSAQYTYSIAEGTGSSTNSSQTAVFRNDDNLPPKVIAPLDFDQTHTAVVNLDFYVPEGKFGFLEMLNANFLISYNSGRPYTPLDVYNIIGDNGILAETDGYINSRTTPSQFRIDLKLEKRFDMGAFSVSPYLWIENLLDADNIINVWQSTGDPNTTNWLKTAEGKAAALNNGQGYIYDYQSLERTPGNYGIPRLIKLGLKVNFSGASL